MEVKEVKNKKIWEDFLSGCEEKTFLQSWNWGVFQKKMGKNIWRLGVYEGDDLLGTSLVFEVDAKRGRHLLLPHGPMISNESWGERGEIVDEMIERLKEIANETGSKFLRLTPVWERNEKNNKVFSERGFRDAPMHTHPEITWEVDLTKDEEDLLMDMRKNTRYDVRKGMKNEDLKIEKSTNIEDVQVFNDLYEKTVKRHDFTPYSLKYLLTEFEVFNRDREIVILNARYKETVISSAMIVIWQRRGFYHQGASDMKYRKISGSHLLQWEAMKEVKKRGGERYNFWGITESDDKNHPFWGLSLFKRGFGGYKKRYLRTKDLSLSPMYHLTRAFEVIRKKKRGF